MAADALKVGVSYLHKDFRLLSKAYRAACGWSLYILHERRLSRLTCKRRVAPRVRVSLYLYEHVAVHVRRQQ
jgi:hypothetical protein